MGIHDYDEEVFISFETDEADEIDNSYYESIYQEYFEWATEFSEGIVASGESGGGWFYPDPIKEPSGELSYDWIDDLFFDPWEEDYSDGNLGEIEHSVDVDYQRQQQKLAKHFHTLWLREQKENCNKERLQSYDLPICGSHKEIARVMGIKVKKLRFFAFSRKTSHYICFQLLKKTGGKRDISAPKPQLKQTQEWILHNILEKLELHNAAHGFCCGRSIVTNAQPYVGAEVIVNIDLQDFFPSISYKRVKGLFKSFGYSEAASIVFGLICTKPKIKEIEIDSKSNFLLSWTERRLPQGAPTSPTISNLLCHRLDRRLAQMAEQLGFVYTRYADDLTFSASGESLSNIYKIIKRTVSIVKHEGFAINANKTRVLRKSQQHEVTGIVVNDKLNISKEKLKRFRATLYQIEKDGLRDKHWGQSNDLIVSIQGFANFVYMINPEKGAKFQEQVRRIKEKYGRKHNKVVAVYETLNLSDVITLTKIELQRLGWSNRKRRRYLKQTYGKQSRQQLTDEQLLEFLRYLKSLPLPSKSLV